MIASRGGVLFVISLFGCGGPNPTVACIEEAQQCEFDEDCCEGVCVDEVCTFGACHPGADTCTVSATCCSGSCVDSQCACTALGQPCRSDGDGGSDCCDGLTCNTDTLLCEDFTSGSLGMSFFVASVGDVALGGNLGGLAAADQKCQALIDAAPVPVEIRNQTWRAYLSTTPTFAGGEPVGDPIHARDRIGAGPWFNFDGVMIAASVADLHANGISSELVLDENGLLAPSDEVILTGSKADGTAETPQDNDFMQFGFDNASCGNWTSNNAFRNTLGGTTAEAALWNSGRRVFCDLGPTSGSTGRFYCFAQ